MVTIVDPEQDHFLSFLSLKPPRKDGAIPMQPARRVLRMTKFRLCPTPTVDDVDEKPDIDVSPAERICERSTSSPTAPSTPVHVQSPPTSSVANESRPNIELPWPVASDSSSSSPRLSRTQSQLNTDLIVQNPVDLRSRRRKLEEPLIEEVADRAEPSSTPSTSAKSNKGPSSSLCEPQPCASSLTSDNAATVTEDQLPLSPSHENLNAPSSCDKPSFISPRIYPASSPVSRQNISTSTNCSDFSIETILDSFTPVVRVSVPCRKKTGKNYRTKYQCQFCNHLKWKRSELAAHITMNHSDQSLIHLCFSCNCFYGREAFLAHENCQA